ncbi:MAG: restriction endonuclease subunit S [Deltaproteobacteria bacterium]|nr:restriction endonuclease subunit S [Deltaproteobacteria bacterium]
MADSCKFKIGDIITLEYGKGLKDYRSGKGKYDVFGTNGKIGLTYEFLYDEPSIIIGRKGAYREVHLAKPPFFVIDTAFYTKKKIKDLDNLYLYFWFKNIDINQMDSGSAIPSTSRDEVYDLDINLPSLPEQKAIASVLSSLDDKIDLLHCQNKTLEAMAETLFRQWFVEEVQEGWEEGKLGDYINVKHGYAFKGKFITTERNNQILVTPGNFKIGGGFKFGKMKYFIGSDYPKEYIFFSDDLIVTMTDLSKEGDTLGYSALIPEHNQDEVLYLHNQRVGRVEFKKDISKYFVYYLMKTDDYQWFILGGASGTSVRHTSPTSICNYPFQVPPMKRIKEFDTIVNELISKVHKNQTQIRTLEKLRDTLLPKLMSGEIRVKI